MVVKLRSLVVVAMLWLATVAGVSVTAWFAIDRAGRDITGGVVGSLPPVTVGATAVTTTPGGGRSATSTTSAPSATQEPSRTQEPSTTHQPPVPPEPSATHAPPAAPTTAARSIPTWRERTALVRGGQVTVRCTGPSIELRIAQPDDGFRVEVGESERAKVNVSFRRGDEESWIGTVVTAVCAKGTPAFTIRDNS